MTWSNAIKSVHPAIEVVGALYFVLLSRAIHRVDLRDSNRVEHVTVVLVVKDASEVVIIPLTWLYNTTVSRHAVTRIVRSQEGVCAYRTL